MIAIIILGLVVVLGVVVFLFSYGSRKEYVCPQCGEKTKYVEHMEARRCGHCGAPLGREET